MPALVSTPHAGTITWLGRVADRAQGLRSAAVPEVMARFGGLDGDAHGGQTRPACARVRALHPRGTEIRNSRQISIVAAEELDDIALRMGLDRVEPGWLGASLVVRGIPDLTHLPPASRLQTEDGTTLTVDMENLPCHLPAAEIDKDAPGRGAAFREAARGRRGVTAWVEREGPLRLGDRVRLFVPAQRPWRPGT